VEAIEADAAEVATAERREAEEAAAKEANLERAIGRAKDATTTTSPGGQRAIAARFHVPMAPEVERRVDAAGVAVDSVVVAVVIEEAPAGVAVVTAEGAAEAPCVEDRGVDAEGPLHIESIDQPKGKLHRQLSFLFFPIRAIDIIIQYSSSTYYYQYYQKEINCTFDC